MSCSVAAYDVARQENAAENLLAWVDIACTTE